MALRRRSGGTSKSDTNKIIAAKLRAWASERSYLCEKTEYYDSRAGRTFDLLGFIDYLFLGQGVCIGVQLTTPGHHVERRKKILGLDSASAWLESGNKILLISFDQEYERQNKYGSSLGILQGREEWITLEQFSK